MVDKKRSSQGEEKRSRDLTKGFLKREKGEDLVDHKDLEIFQSFLMGEKVRIWMIT